MCTLTYIPLANGYIFTHNRDERQDRPSSQTIIQKTRSQQTLYFPQDLEAKGTWIAYSNRKISACILNGGSEPHTRKSSYRKSRGVVVLESFDFENPERFYKEYDFDDIEPFTLIIWHPTGLFKLIHNEQNTLLHELDMHQTHIWSSTTLYTKEVRTKREKWFENWLSHKPRLSPENMTRFHLSAGDGDQENDLVMSRWGILKTVSLTQISHISNSTHILYHDFVHATEDKMHLPHDESPGSF